MAELREKNGESRRSAAQATTGNNILFITLSSGEFWTLGSDASSKPTQHELAIYALLGRARYARDDIESVYWQLARIARQAYKLRRMEAVELASQIMLALPVSSQRKTVARHYQALCLYRKGLFEDARHRLDDLLEDELDPRLRSQALLDKAATYFDVGRIDQSLRFYVEAGQVARDCEPVALITSLRMAAVIKSIHGDHDKAASDLESLMPMGSRILRRDPEAYALLLNSYAVELGEAGHVEQALKVASRIAPFAFIHPEFNETITELQSKLPTRKHSVVVIHRPAEPIAAPKAKLNPVRKRVRLSTFILREAERRFTSYRAPPARCVQFTTTNTVSNPARQPAKPRAP